MTHLNWKRRHYSSGILHCLKRLRFRTASRSCLRLWSKRPISLSRGLPVVFADIDGEKLASLSAVEVSYPAIVTLWEVDFESKADDPLAGKTFDAIMVFNYLHRALIDRIKQAVRPGGLVFYETFTEQQRRFGRPRNPDFLLKPDELKAWFETWQIIHYEERERANPQAMLRVWLPENPRPAIF